MKQKIYVYSILLLISLWRTGIAADTSSIVAAIIPDVGQSKVVENNGTGAPVIVFEENHASVKGQIQQAMMLTRLHDNFKLNSIILEGYSAGSLDESAAKIRKLMSGSSGEIKENIAASLLAEGEISAVEFIKLVYPDLSVEKGETKTNTNIRKTVDEAEYVLPWL